ncbi:hypothetical protein [Nocardia asiatica]|uniref:hypothetical protein n=1 Tax=Nocardia asiatica TaxID=209252 RepID=UPI003EDEFCD8
MAEQHGTETEFMTNSRVAEQITHDHTPTSHGIGSHAGGCGGAADALLVPPEVCVHAEVGLAHEQMRTHLACRIERCAWKAAAFRTLVCAGHQTPQATSHRERASARGLEFPVDDRFRSADHSPDRHTIQAALERLSALTAPPEPLG